jgi:hypothetical protein
MFSCKYSSGIANRDPGAGYHEAPQSTRSAASLDSFDTNCTQGSVREPDFYARVGEKCRVLRNERTLNLGKYTVEVGRCERRNFRDGGHSGDEFWDQPNVFLGDGYGAVDNELLYPNFIKSG